MIYKGKDYLIRERETLEDVCKTNCTIGLHSSHAAKRGTGYKSRYYIFMKSLRDDM